jgi:hypothetical protein
MQLRSFAGDLRILSMERMTSSINSSTSVRSRSGQTDQFFGHYGSGDAPFSWSDWVFSPNGHSLGCAPFQRVP